MVLELPKKVKQIITTLQEHGQEAYAVGGCVRDVMLGRVPKDWDITTSARPMQVKELFRRTVDTGIQHGTVTVLLDKEGFEVTTYRVDGIYEDGRHPKEVSFTASLAEDLKRRDFTINAMAYNETEGLVDLFGGASDLRKGVIRCVGVARERFSEDALRILRAFRFAAQLDFCIEEETMQAAQELADTLQKISAERISAELMKILLSNHPEWLLYASEHHITEVVFPEFDLMCATAQNDSAQNVSVGIHSLRTVAAIGKKSVFSGETFEEREFCYLRLAALLHDVGKPVCQTQDETGTDYFYGHGEAGAELTKKILRKRKMDNATIDIVTKLVRFHEYAFVPEEHLVRRAMYELGADMVPLLLELRYADLLASAEPYQREELENLKIVWKIYQEVCQKGQCTSLKGLAVNGSDLIAAGFAPGRELGEVLEELLLLVVEEPEKNTKEVLLTKALERNKKIDT